MSYQAELQAIEGRLLDNYTATPVAIDESGPIIDPATRNIVEQPDDAAWVRISVRGAREEQASIGGAGSNRFRNYGLIIVQVFTPMREGPQAGRSIADTVGAIYRRQQFSGITCRGASVRDLGKVAGWIQHNVEIAYWRDNNF
jgi:hypothetical protein